MIGPWGERDKVIGMVLVPEVKYYFVKLWDMGLG